MCAPNSFASNMHKKSSQATPPQRCEGRKLCAAQHRRHMNSVLITLNAKMHSGTMARAPVDAARADRIVRALIKLLSEQFINSTDWTPKNRWASSISHQAIIIVYLCPLNSHTRRVPSYWLSSFIARCCAPPSPAQRQSSVIFSFTVP